MRLGKKVKRLFKLGFFLGIGAVSAVVSACTSTPDVPSDTGVADQSTHDQRGPDRGSMADLGPDATPPDRSLVDKGKADKKPGWDIPLE